MAAASGAPPAGTPLAGRGHMAYLSRWWFRREGSRMIFEKWRDNAAKVKRAGALAVEAARRAGVPAYYRDAGLGPGIVKEMPDGTRHLIEVAGRNDIVKKTFGPRR